MIYKTLLIVKLAPWGEHLKLIQKKLYQNHKRKYGLSFFHIKKFSSLDKKQNEVTKKSKLIICEPFFDGQVSHQGASDFACIGAIICVTEKIKNSEQWWLSQIEYSVPDSFWTRAGPECHRVYSQLSTGQNLDWKTSVFQKHQRSQYYLFKWNMIYVSSEPTKAEVRNAKQPKQNHRTRKVEIQKTRYQ